MFQFKQQKITSEERKKKNKWKEKKQNNSRKKNKQQNEKKSFHRHWDTFWLKRQGLSQGGVQTPSRNWNLKGKKFGLLTKIWKRMTKEIQIPPSMVRTSPPLKKWKGKERISRSVLHSSFAVAFEFLVSLSIYRSIPCLFLFHSSIIGIFSLKFCLILFLHYLSISLKKLHVSTFISIELKNNNKKTDE